MKGLSASCDFLVDAFPKSEDLYKTARDGIPDEEREDMK